MLWARHIAGVHKYCTVYLSCHIKGVLIIHLGCPEELLLHVSNKSNLEVNCLFVWSVFLSDSNSYKALGAAINFE